MARRVSSPTFVGRSRELAALESALRRAASGEPAALLVGGEAGIGKSRLVGELTARAVDAGFSVLSGGCAALSRPTVPLLPIAEALRQIDAGQDEELRALVAAPPPALAGLLPAWPAVRGDSGSASPLVLFELVLGLFRRVAEARPLVLVVEDVHWADRTTLDLLGFVLHNLRAERLVVAVTFRSDERDAPGLRPWLAEAARSKAAERLELERFSPEELRQLLAYILDGAPPPGLAERIHARSDGNAFMAEELLAAADGIPETLGDALLARLELLGAEAQEVVRAAAASGRRVHHRLLGAVVDLPEAALARALREAVRHHVLVAGDGWFEFRHALLREVAYRELLPGESQRLHAAVADALERDPDAAGGNAATVAAEIAEHRWRSEDWERALPASVSAGLEAERVHAPAEAQAELERALELWDRVAGADELVPVDRADVLGHAAAAASARGRDGRAVELVEEALRHAEADEDPVRAALLHERRFRYLSRQGANDAALDAAETAVRLLPAEPPSPERAQVLASAGYANMHVARWAEAHALCVEALAAARTIGATLQEGLALTSLGGVLGALGDNDAAIAHLGEALGILCEQGHAEDAARAAVNLSDRLLVEGRLEQAVAVAAECIAEARRTGLELTYGAMAELNLCLALLDLGRWDEVDRLTRDAIRRPLTGLPAAAAFMMRAELETWRGEPAAAEGHLRAATAAAPGDLPPEDLWFLQERELELAIWQGRLDDARPYVDSALGLLDEAEDVYYRLRLAHAAIRVEAARAELAHVHRDAAAVQDARARARMLDEGARRAAAALAGGRAGPPTAALLACVTAERSRAEGAPDPAAWAAAVRACEAWGAPHRIAYARWRWAETLLAARAPRAEAAAVLRPAHEAARHLGASVLVTEIELLARRARIDLGGRTPEPASPSGPAEALGLTARELDVLEHLAAGRTNRQIAEALFISVKTAGVHVSSILRKLDASTRGEAAAAAHRAGLLADRVAG